MENNTNIPEAHFENRQRKTYEFEILSNRKILLEEIPTDHNPFCPHRLRFYAILFIREGEGQHFIDFKKYTYRRGSIIFIAKEQVHAFEKNMNREATFMLFTEHFLEKSSLGSSLMQELSLYNYHLYPPILQLEERHISLFSTLVNHMVEEYESKDDFATEEMILSSLKIFLLLAERIRRKNRQAEIQSAYYTEFLIFQKLLKKHLFETRQVQFYANQLNISPKKLNMIIKQVMHLSAKTYINEQLILEMKRFLMNTALSVKEIAYQTGFEEPTNFVKFFKKYAHQTPVDFRKAFKPKKP